MQERRPSVSVVVPAFNASGTVQRCIDSILSQENVLVEVIVVDDGSTDATGAILDAYEAAHHGVHVLHVTNGGPSRARNIGLAEATGEYVGFCDADDWVDRGCYARAVKAAEVAGADVVVFGYKNVRPGSTRTHAWRSERQLRAREFAERCLLDPRVRGFACNKLYSRELVARERFPEGVSVCEDLLFNIHISRGKEDLVALCIPGAPYNYELSGESLTRSVGSGSVVRGVVAGLLADPVLAPAARAALYCSAAKDSFEMARGGVAPCVDDLRWWRDFYASRSCPVSEKAKVLARRIVVRLLRLWGASDEPGGGEEPSHPRRGAQGEQAGHRDGRR